MAVSKVGKPILKLTDRDYRAHGMGDLIAERGPSNKINIEVFNGLQKQLPVREVNPMRMTLPDRKEHFLIPKGSSVQSAPR